MTRLQQLLFKLGASRFRRFRRWVGGAWREVWHYATPHSSELDYTRWEPTVPTAADTCHAIELWPNKNVPIARAIKAPLRRLPPPIVVTTTVRVVCSPECRCEMCGYPWRGCACGATPETGADPSCDREPLGIQYGCRALRDRKSV